MNLRERIESHVPGILDFLVFDPAELSFWEDVARQKLFLRLVGRRWFVDEIEWTSGPQKFVAWIKLRAVLT